jgi:CubicO group peptidase (beta-lactamase class C family)
MKHAAVLAGILALAATTARADAVDDLFARYKADTPGCAIGVARPGQPNLLRGYGSADLEHAVPITADTIFEAGSVSKQFTAAAILTLVADGKIALSDDIRKYLPEMPAYSAPITVDMLLSHTSGLRDWGEVEAVAGWPRGSRVYNHDEVLQIAARQKGLNYPPGTAYSYTNTGYNLAAIIVKRVSGKSLADFTAERIFKPLGMTHTGWRDDYRNIVPGRAQAYDKVGGRYMLDMPFENVHGNSSLLTTVGDLLIWNQALTDRKLGVVADQLQQQAVLNSGRKIEYARGLFVSAYRGVRLVNHTGATAGYRPGSTATRTRACRSPCSATPATPTAASRAGSPTQS